MRREAKALLVLVLLLTVVVARARARQSRRWRGRCRRRWSIRRDDPPPPPAPPQPVSEPVVGAADAGRGHDRIEVARRSESRLPAAPAVLRARQLRRQRRGTAGAAGQRRGAEEVPDHGRSRSRDTATSAARPNTTWPSASGARWRRRITWSRSAFPPTRSRRSATARSSRSMRVTTMRRGRRTGARIS